MRRAALALALLCACPAPRVEPDAGGASGIPPEERFGNDPELLADFANLKACTYGKGRLDHACPEVKTLKLRLETKARTPSRRKKMITTLANLLESRKEVSRLMAAHSLYPVHKERAITTALDGALLREKVPAIKAVMLRQLCWTPGPRPEKVALALLGGANPAVVRVQAARCMGRLEKLSAPAQKAVEKALTGEDPRVAAAACAVAGKHRMALSVPALANLLDNKDLGWRCAPALAAVGGKQAYAALLKATASAAGKGEVPAPFISALASFKGQAFFDGEKVAGLLERIEGNKSVSRLSRLRAGEALKGLKKP